MWFYITLRFLNLDVVLYYTEVSPSVCGFQPAQGSLSGRSSALLQQGQLAARGRQNVSGILYNSSSYSVIDIFTYTDLLLSVSSFHLH